MMCSLSILGFYRSIGVHVGSIQPLLILFFSIGFSIFLTVLFFMALLPSCRSLIHLFEIRETHRVYPDPAAFAGPVLSISFFSFRFPFLHHDDGSSLKGLHVCSVRMSMLLVAGKQPGTADVLSQDVFLRVELNFSAGPDADDFCCHRFPAASFPLLSIID
jgi:hypothetical protein